MIALSQITAVILAGGQGARMGGIDKGLQTLHGRPLVAHAMQRLRQGGISQIMINANRNLSTYASLAAPVWPDESADYPGPLAGFLSGLQHCKTPYLLTVACDTPLLPLDLAVRLAQALHVNQAEIAMAAAPETDATAGVALRAQPVFCLMQVQVRERLQAFIAQGGRKVQAWTAQHHTVSVPFDQPQDDPRAFFNANTLAELQYLENTTA